MIGVLYLFYALGLWPVSVALLAYYMRTFLNGDQYKSGRPWHAFRRHKLWDFINLYLKVDQTHAATNGESAQLPCDAFLTSPLIPFFCCLFAD